MAIIALNSASSGLSALSTELDVIANNLANVNTTGFKRSRAHFEDLLYQTVQGAAVVGGADASSIPAIQVGRGVKLAAVQRMHGQGPLEPTQRPLDMERSARDLVPQARALHVLEHQKHRAVGQLSEVRGGSNVSVLDVGGCHRFALETRDHLRHRGELAVQHFDGEPLAHQHVLGGVHFAHAALAEQRVDSIAIGQDRTDSRVGLGLVAGAERGS